MSSDLSSRTVNIQDFDRICRICLEEENLCPISSFYKNDLKIADLLEYSIMSDVTIETLPQNICDKCLDNVYKVYEFKKQCQDLETILKKLVDQTSKFESGDDHYKIHIPLAYETLKFEENTSADEDSKSNISVHDDDLLFKSEIDVKNEAPDKRLCRFCGKGFTKEECLQAHEIVHEMTDRKPIKKSVPVKKLRREPKTYKCSHCGRVFKILRFFNAHVKLHTSGYQGDQSKKPKLSRDYLCETCGRAYSHQGAFIIHRKTHREFLCSDCGKRFSSKSTLQVHSTIHKVKKLRRQPKTTYTCSHCGREFKILYFFNAHVKQHTSGDQTDRSEKPEQSRDYVCETCGRAYRHQRVLIAHRKTHAEKTFLCSDCGKRFRTKSALQMHSTIHTGERAYTCSVCKRSFKRLGVLDLHMRLHSGYKPYKCTLCPKSFVQISQYKTHMRRHNGEKPYSCSICNKRFVVNGKLKVHMRSHTGERPNKCPVCGKGFYCSGTLQKHRQNEKSPCFKTEVGRRAEQEPEPMS